MSSFQKKQPLLLEEGGAGKPGVANMGGSKLAVTGRRDYNRVMVLRPALSTISW